jgi:DNA polymerase V
MKIIALMDCNNFYASCERVFDPRLRKKPLVILSNNDGCVIARSYEAKDLGVEMGVPVFKCEYLMKRHQIQKRSANFSLYADLSQRVMSILEQASSELEVYSIDEAFFSLGDSADWTYEALLEKAREIQNKIERDVGISVSIGFATSKTLAKVANKIAKQKKCGVFSLYFSEDQEIQNAKVDYYLADFMATDVWGLGRNYCKFLNRHGFKTALDFKYAERRWVRQEMKVQGLRTCMELAGIPCIEMDTNEYEKEDAKSIISSRSFGSRVRSLEALQEAVSNFVAVAAYKMRRSDKVTRCLQVMLRGIDKESSSYSYEKNWHGYRIDNTAVLNTYTNSTAKLITAARKAVAEIFNPSLYYKKAGVVFVGLKDATAVQIPLVANPSSFAANFDRDNKLNKLVDTINDRSGTNTLFWAAMGNRKIRTEGNWRAQQNHRSPSYTTDWADLPLIY